MDNNNINKNELDAFSEKVKSKLENHRLELDADLWNSIQQAVVAKQQRRLPVWLWIPLSSVAVIALVLMLRPIVQSPQLLSHSTTVRTIKIKNISTEKSLSEKIIAYVAAPTQIVRKFSAIKEPKALTSESKISTPVSLASTVLSLSDNIVKAGTTYTSIMAPQSFSNVNYSLPLSFGLKVRNKFSERLSVETGLIYTYLQTDFSNSGFSTTDARLGLHYLGIPVSLNVKVWNNPKWEIYVSGGGMVEKGLRSIYQQTQNNTFQTWFTTAQTNIVGFQFSVNSAVGLSYKIMPKIGIFFEPQFSYYFENGQPISIRSHLPTVFGLQIGLRYNLKK